MPRKVLPLPKPLDAESALPLYRQLFDRLRKAILRGVFAPGALLPSETELGADYGVSRITVRRAVEELRQLGLVQPEKGRGVRVRKPAIMQTAPVLGAIEGLIENNLAMGLETEVELREFDYLPASPDVAQALGLPEGATVQHAVRVRSHDGVPFSHLTTFVPEHIGRGFDKAEMAKHPLLLLLERNGIEVAGARQTITAQTAPRHIARLLNVETGSALLRIERIVTAQDDAAVEYIIGLYRPDIYAYRMRLQRELGPGVNRWAHVPRGEAAAD